MPTTGLNRVDKEHREQMSTPIQWRQGDERLRHETAENRCQHQYNGDREMND